MSEYYKTFVPKLSIDGDMWCALYGDNLQEGIAGFGDILAQALKDFDYQFTKSINELIHIN